MVRTVRSIEEEARVKIIRDIGQDRYLADQTLLQAIEDKRIEELLAWASDGTRRALVVGLEDRGRIALALAQKGLFVTVVEPDESLHEAVRKAADEGRFGIRMNFYASDYMKREFQTSGFDVVVFFSTINRYNEPLVVMKKAARELRAGGRVFARVHVRPSTGILKTLSTRVPKFNIALDKMLEYLEQIESVKNFLALPESKGFLEGVGQVYKIEKVIRYHLLAPFVATLAMKGTPWARDLLDHAVALDEALENSRVASPLMTHLAIFAVRELQLGKTFRL